MILLCFSIQLLLCMPGLVLLPLAQVMLAQVKFPSPFARAYRIHIGPFQADGELLCRMFLTPCRDEPDETESELWHHATTGKACCFCTTAIFLMYADITDHLQAAGIRSDHPIVNYLTFIGLTSDIAFAEFRKNTDDLIAWCDKFKRSSLVNTRLDP